MNTQSSWYDFVSNKYSTVQPTTDEIAKRYISQNPSAQNMYNLLRQHMDCDINHALLRVLESMAGIKAGTP